MMAWTGGPGNTPTSRQCPTFSEREILGGGGAAGTEGAGVGFTTGGAYKGAKIFRRALETGEGRSVDADKPGPPLVAIASDDVPLGPHSITTKPTDVTPIKPTNTAFTTRHPSPAPNRLAHEGKEITTLENTSRQFLTKFILIL